MKTINETKTLTNVHLSDSQKMVMAKIKASANSHVASEQARNSANLASAQQTLSKLGLVDIDDSGATITNKGELTMADENLVDGGGSLTPEGQKYADAKDLTSLASADNEQPTDTPPVPDVDGQGAESVGESLSLFKDINAMANIKQL